MVANTHYSIDPRLSSTITHLLTPGGSRPHNAGRKSCPSGSASRQTRANEAAQMQTGLVLDCSVSLDIIYAKVFLKPPLLKPSHQIFKVSVISFNSINCRAAQGQVSRHERASTHSHYDSIIVYFGRSPTSAQTLGTFLFI